MISRLHLLGAWSGFVFLSLFFVGFWLLAHFLPGHNPSASAEEIAALYQSNTNGIRIGMLLVLFGSVFFLPWNVSINALIRRMEGPSDFLSQCQITGAIVCSLYFSIPAMFWEMAAFRPDRSPDLTLLLNDGGWILLITAVPPFVLQCVPLGFAILNDKNPQPLFPRWFGYAILWAVVTYLPGDVAYFFKTGPFAWNGLFPYWVPFTIYGGWVMMMSVMMLKIINRLIETAPSPASGAHRVAAAE